MLDRLKMMEARYNEINDLLMQPETAADVKKLTALSKEQKSLEKVVTLFHEQQKLEASIPEETVDAPSVEGEQRLQQSGCFHPLFQQG